MNDADRLDRLLSELLVECAPHRPPERLIPETRRALRHVRRRPVWFARLKERPMHISSQVAVGSPTMRLAFTALIALSLTILTAGTVVVGGSLLSGPAPGAACEDGPGAFEPGPELETSRRQFPIAQLSDGRVLVVGGTSAGDLPVRAAELFEPDTGAFRPAGTLGRVAPYLFVVVRLADDRVFVPPFRSIVPAEVWDPQTESFSTTGSPLAERGDYSPLVLADGRVLVIGGNRFVAGGELEPILDAEIWDPATGEFSIEPTLAGIAPDSATLLADGDVLLLGGLEWQGDTPLPGESWALRWDPTSGTITPAASPTLARSAAKTVRLTDGRVLLVGGIDAQGMVAEAEVYDPVSDTFTSAGSLAQGRFLHLATLLPDGRVLVTGGLGAAFSDPIRDAAIWDPETTTFSPAGTLAEGRAEHGAAVMPDCSVLIMAGTFGEQATPVGIERWVPGAGTNAGG
jgi:hypothetical protein